jgi:iron-sulfur cluster insertion protein
MPQSAAAVAYSTEIAENDVRITPAARAKLVELLGEAEPGLDVIRVFVSGGGCSGMGYGMTFSESVTDYDGVLEGDGFKLAIDAVALNYLQGSEIDFTGDAFVFSNVFQSVGGSGACGGCGGGRGF